MAKTANNTSQFAAFVGKQPQAGSLGGSLQPAAVDKLPLTSQMVPQDTNFCRNPCEALGPTVLRSQDLCREIYFLILHFLGMGPCTKAAEHLEEELRVHDLLPRRCHAGARRAAVQPDCLDAISLPLIYKDVAIRNPHIPKDHLIQLLQQLLTWRARDQVKLDGSSRLTCTAADVPTLLGSGPFSLLDSELKQKCTPLARWMIWPHEKAGPVRGLQLREIGGGFAGLQNRLPAVKAASCAIAPPGLLVKHLGYTCCLRGHRNSVYCALFDLTGKFLLTGSDDWLVKIWCVETGLLLRTCKGHSGDITDMAVSHDNKLVASGSNDRDIRVWHLPGGEPLAQLRGHEEAVTAVAFSPRQGCESILLSASEDFTCRLWDVRTHAVQVFKPSRPELGPSPPQPTGAASSSSQARFSILCCAFSADGRIFVTGSTDKLARVWSAGSLQDPEAWHGCSELAVLSGHEQEVNYVQFSGCSVPPKLWQNGEPPQELTGAFSNSPTVGHIVTCSRDGSAIIWRPKATRLNPKCSSWVKAYHLKVPNPTAPPPRGFPRRPMPTPRGVNMVVWSLDNQFVLAAIMDCRICVWNATDGSLVHSLEGHEKQTYVLDVHPFNPRIAMSAGYDSRVFVWDIWEGKAIKKFVIPGDAQLVDGHFSPDGTALVISDDVGQVYLYSTGVGASQRFAFYDQFFPGDYAELVADNEGNLLDKETRLPPHERNLQDPLCNAAFMPYSESSQRAYYQMRFRVLGMDPRAGAPPPLPMSTSHIPPEALENALLAPSTPRMATDPLVFPSDRAPTAVGTPEGEEAENSNHPGSDSDFEAPSDEDDDGAEAGLQPRERPGKRTVRPNRKYLEDSPPQPRRSRRLVQEPDSDDEAPRTRARMARSRAVDFDVEQGGPVETPEDSDQLLLTIKRRSGRQVKRKRLAEVCCLSEDEDVRGGTPLAQEGVTLDERQLGRALLERKAPEVTELELQRPEAGVDGDAGKEGGREGTPQEVRRGPLKVRMKRAARKAGMGQAGPEHEGVRATVGSEEVVVEEWEGEVEAVPHAVARAAHGSAQLAREDSVRLGWSVQRCSAVREGHAGSTATTAYDRCVQAGDAATAAAAASGGNRNGLAWGPRRKRRLRRPHQMRGGELEDGAAQEGSEDVVSQAVPREENGGWEAVSWDDRSGTRRPDKEKARQGNFKVGGWASLPGGQNEGGMGSGIGDESAIDGNHTERRLAGLVRLANGTLEGAQEQGLMGHGIPRVIGSHAQQAVTTLAPPGNAPSTHPCVPLAGGDRAGDGSPLAGSPLSMGSGLQPTGIGMCPGLQPVDAALPAASPSATPFERAHLSTAGARPASAQIRAHPLAIIASPPPVVACSGAQQPRPPPLLPPSRPPFPTEALATPRISLLSPFPTSPITQQVHEIWGLRALLGMPSLLPPQAFSGLPPPGPAALPRGSLPGPTVIRPQAVHPPRVETLPLSRREAHPAPPAQSGLTHLDAGAIPQQEPFQKLQDTMPRPCSSPADPLRSPFVDPSHSSLTVLSRSAAEMPLDAAGSGLGRSWHKKPAGQSALEGQVTPPVSAARRPGGGRNVSSSVASQPGVQRQSMQPLPPPPQEQQQQQLQQPPPHQQQSQQPPSQQHQSQQLKHEPGPQQQPGPSGQRAQHSASPACFGSVPAPLARQLRGAAANVQGYGAAHESALEVDNRSTSNGNQEVVAGDSQAGDGEGVICEKGAMTAASSEPEVSGMGNVSALDSVLDPLMSPPGDSHSMGALRLGGAAAAVFRPLVGSAAGTQTQAGASGQQLGQVPNSLVPVGSWGLGIEQGMGLGQVEGPVEGQGSLEGEKPAQGEAGIQRERRGGCAGGIARRAGTGRGGQAHAVAANGVHACAATVGGAATAPSQPVAMAGTVEGAGTAPAGAVAMAGTAGGTAPAPFQPVAWTGAPPSAAPYQLGEQPAGALQFRGPSPVGPHFRGHFTGQGVTAPQLRGQGPTVVPTAPQLRPQGLTPPQAKARGVTPSLARGHGVAPPQFGGQGLVPALLREQAASQLRGQTRPAPVQGVPVRARRGTAASRALAGPGALPAQPNGGTESTAYPPLVEASMKTAPQPRPRPSPMTPPSPSLMSAPQPSPMTAPHPAASPRPSQSLPPQVGVLRMSAQAPPIPTRPHLGAAQGARLREVASGPPQPHRTQKRSVGPGGAAVSQAAAACDVVGEAAASALGGAAGGDIQEGATAAAQRPGSGMPGQAAASQDLDMKPRFFANGVQLPSREGDRQGDTTSNPPSSTALGTPYADPRGPPALLRPSVQAAAAASRCQPVVPVPLIPAAGSGGLGMEATGLGVAVLGRARYSKVQQNSAPASAFRRSEVHGGAQEVRRAATSPLRMVVKEEPGLGLDQQEHLVCFESKVGETEREVGAIFRDRSRPLARQPSGLSASLWPGPEALGELDGESFLGGHVPVGVEMRVRDECGMQPPVAASLPCKGGGASLASQAKQEVVFPSDAAKDGAAAGDRAGVRKARTAREARGMGVWVEGEEATRVSGVEGELAKGVSGVEGEEVKRARGNEGEEVKGVSGCEGDEFKPVLTASGTGGAVQGSAGSHGSGAGGVQRRPRSRLAVKARGLQEGRHEERVKEEEEGKAGDGPTDGPWEAAGRGAEVKDEPVEGSSVRLGSDQRPSWLRGQKRTSMAEEKVLSRRSGEDASKVAGGSRSCSVGDDDWDRRAAKRGRGALKELISLSMSTEWAGAQGGSRMGAAGKLGEHGAGRKVSRSGAGASRQLAGSEAQAACMPEGSEVQKEWDDSGNRLLKGAEMNQSKEDKAWEDGEEVVVQGDEEDALVGDEGQEQEGGEEEDVDEDNGIEEVSSEGERGRRRHNKGRKGQQRGRMGGDRGQRESRKPTRPAGERVGAQVQMERQEHSMSSGVRTASRNATAPESSTTGKEGEGGSVRSLRAERGVGRMGANEGLMEVEDGKWGGRRRKKSLARDPWGNEWLTMLEVEEGTRYIPQCGDDVVYLRQGHAEFLEKTGRSQDEGPWTLFSRRLHPVEYCKVIALEYARLGTGDFRRTVAQLTLQFTAKKSRLCGETFEVTMPELKQQADFLVERGRYDFAIKKNWSVRDRCQVWWAEESESSDSDEEDEEEEDKSECGGSGKWWNCMIKKIEPLAKEYVESPWDRYVVRYTDRDCSDGESMRHSPWELVDPAEKVVWQTSRLDGPAVAKLLEAIREVERRIEGWAIEEGGEANGLFGWMGSQKEVPVGAKYVEIAIVPVTLAMVKARLNSRYYRGSLAVAHDLKQLLQSATYVFGAESRSVMRAAEAVEMLLCEVEQGQEETSKDRKMNG